jgi:hypothetical protein
MDRREFTVEAAKALLGGAVIAISGCGGGSGTGPTSSTPPVTDVEGLVAVNHGHSATITAAQLTAGGALQLDIRGTASHSHMVSLTADEVAAIRSRAVVLKESGGNSHTHTITFNA